MGVNLYLSEKDLESLMKIIEYATSGFTDTDDQKQIETTANKVYKAYYKVKQRKKEAFIE